MHIVLVAAVAALSLGACSAGGTGEAHANSDKNAENMMNHDMTADENVMLANGAGGLDGNTATNAATENMMLNDLTFNKADTNLANRI